MGWGALDYLSCKMGGYQKWPRQWLRRNFLRVLGISTILLICCAEVILCSFKSGVDIDQLNAADLDVDTRTGPSESLNLETPSKASSKDLTQGLSSVDYVVGKPLENINLDYKKNIFFSVKTTAKNYRTRLSLLLLTWFQAVNKDQVRYY